MLRAAASISSMCAGVESSSSGSAAQPAAASLKAQAPSTLQDEPQTLGISPVSPISEQSPSRPTYRSLSVLCHGMYHHTCSVTPPCYQAGTGTGGCWGHIWGRGRDTAQTERPENAATAKRWEATPIRLFIPMLNGQGSQKAIPRLAFTTNAIKN